MVSFCYQMADPMVAVNRNDKRAGEIISAFEDCKESGHDSLLICADPFLDLLQGVLNRAAFKTKF